MDTLLCVHTLWTPCIVVCVRRLAPNDREMLKGFLDVAVLPLRPSLKTCGKGESLRTATCLNTVVGGKQGHAQNIGGRG